MTVAATARPKLARGVRLKFDDARDSWVLLAPERVLVLDAIAHSVIVLCTGERDVEEICELLHADYEAPRKVIARDVTELLDDLIAKGYVSA